MIPADRALLLHVAEQLDSLSHLVCDLVERHLAGDSAGSGPVRPCGAGRGQDGPESVPAQSEAAEGRGDGEVGR